MGKKKKKKKRRKLLGLSCWSLVEVLKPTGSIFRLGDDDQYIHNLQRRYTDSFLRGKINHWRIVVCGVTHGLLLEESEGLLSCWVLSVLWGNEHWSWNACVNGNHEKPVHLRFLVSNPPLTKFWPTLYMEFKDRGSHVAYMQLHTILDPPAYLSIHQLVQGFFFFFFFGEYGVIEFPHYIEIGVVPELHLIIKVSVEDNDSLTSL